MRKGLLSALLILGLILCLCPAAAAADSTLDAVSVTVQTPFVGSAPSYEASCPADASYVVERVTWYSGGQEVAAGTTFDIGSQYEVAVVMVPKNGYSFASDVNALLNGQQVPAQREATRDGIVLRRAFSVEQYDDSDASLTEITAVSATVPAPVAGAYPSYQVTLPEDGSYEISRISGWWYGMMDQRLDDPFSEGVSYRIEFVLSPKSGYRFSRNLTGTVNGGAATVSLWDDGTVSVAYTFPATTDREEVSEVNVSITAPVAGVLADQVCRFNGDGRYEINEITWYYDQMDLQPEYPFSEGVVYRVNLRVHPLPGNKLSDHLAATVNGNQAEVSAGEDGSAIVAYTFPAAEKPGAGGTVSHVSATVPAPVTGVQSSSTAAVPANAGYSVSRVDWWYNPFDNRSQYVFEPETEYHVAIYLTLDPRYTFAEELTASINGKEATITWIESDFCRINLAFPATLAEGESPFSDVPMSSWYGKSVVWAVSNGVTDGTGGGKFSPGDTCDRGTIITFLWKYAGRPEPSGSSCPYQDVKENAWYYKAVLWALESGILEAEGDRFGPGDTVARSEIVTYFWRYAGKPDPRSAENPFSDVTSAADYYKAVLWAKEARITDGTGGGKFSPNGLCDRSQIVTFLWNHAGRP